MPLWASYLVKAYAWRGMFSAGGPIAWLAAPFGLSSPGYGLTATTITLAYLWLPYMILPIFAAWSGCRTRCSRPRPTSAAARC